MHQKLSIADLPIKGKKVLMRVDFNVPLDSKGNITDDSRILGALRSIKYVLDAGASLILMSHLGRPKGEKRASLSLAPCARLLSKILAVEVQMAPDCIGSQVEVMAASLKPGQVMLLENLRFHPEEEKPEADASFAKSLASLADFYVNDAFGTAHRIHSSTVIIARFFRGRSAAGFLMEKEIEFLGKALLSPIRPFWAVIGGSKVSGKLGILKSLVDKVDGVLIGGGMAYTFLRAQGFDVGDSLIEEDQLECAKKIIEKCNRCNVEIILPVDHLVAQAISENAKTRVIGAGNAIPPGEMGIDIGPETRRLFEDKLKNAKTIFWNGPLGVFEIAAFSQGTYDLAKVIASLDAVTVIGGGDSAAAVQAAGYSERMSHISTGGGASLEFIQNGTLPGAEALTDAEFQLRGGC